MHNYILAVGSAAKRRRLIRAFVFPRNRTARSVTARARSSAARARAMASTTARTASATGRSRRERTTPPPARGEGVWMCHAQREGTVPSRGEGKQAPLKNMEREGGYQAKGCSQGWRRQCEGAALWVDHTHGCGVAHGAKSH